MKDNVFFTITCAVTPILLISPLKHHQILDSKLSLQGRNYLRAEGGHGPCQPLKKNSLVYILKKKKKLALKLIYLAPLSQIIYKLTHETKNGKKIIKSSLVWLSQEYQEKHLAKHLDNLQIRVTKKIYKTINIFR